MHAYASGLVALLLATVAPIAQAGIGDVDPGYGVNGRFEVRPLGQFFVYPPLADGRLLYPAEGGYRRTDINGMPDETFGSGGVQAWPQGYGPLGSGAWSRTGDGRLLVALQHSGAGGDEFAVMRLGPDGEPDAGFGMDGLAVINVPTNGSRAASSLNVQPDGKVLLLLVGYADWYNINSVLLVRLLPDGRLDAAFGDGGSVAVSTSLVDAMDGVGLTVLADGRIGVDANPVSWLTQSGDIDLDPHHGREWPIAAPLPGGGAIAWTRTSAGYQLSKVMANGSFDTSFGLNGDGTASLPAEADYLSGISVSPDGSYIFVTWGRSTDGHWRVSRLIGDGPSAGQPDTSFGYQGTVDLKSTNASGAVYGLLDGGAIITTADYAYRLLGRDAPGPGMTGVDLYRIGFASESDGAATLQIFRAAGSDGAIRLRYRTLAESELSQQPGVSFATPGVDFDAVDGVLDWSDGDDGDKVIRIPLRNDQVQEGTEQIYVRFEALSSGSWTVPELVAVPVNDPPSYQAPTGGQASGVGASSGGHTSSGGGSFGWPGLLLMLAAFARRWALRGPALLLLAGSAQAQLAPGDVDPGFVYPQPTVREPDSTNAVALPSGFIIVKSKEPQPPATESTLALTLIDKDGRVIVDAFGTDGTYTNHVPGVVNVATAAVRLANGAFAFGGFKRVEGSSQDSVAAIAMVDATGALDPAFGAGGVATFDVQGTMDRVGALAELPDGRIAALVWSRHYADPYGDCDVTWMVLVLLSPDGQHADVADAQRRDSWVGGCRDSFTMSMGPGGTLLYGNELNVFDGSAGLFPINWRYGPFAYDSSLGLLSTTIDGLGIGIVVPATRPPGNLYPSLRTLVGFDDEQVTYTKLVPDLPHERFYLGLSSDGGRVAIVRFRLDGSLDTGWGRGGAVVVKDAGQGGVLLSGGLATELRLLAVQEDGSVVVVTADGIVERLAGGNGVAHGVFKLDTDYVSVTEVNGSVPIRVQRVDGASGAVTVDLVIGYCASASTGACGGQPDAATPGEDFVESRVTLEYSDGDTSPRRVDVMLLDDSRKEPTEVFRVKLLNPTGGAQILGGDAWVYVQDNDGGATGGPSPGPGPVGQGGGGGLVGEQLLALLVLALALRRYRMRPGLRAQVIVRNGT